MRCPSCLTLYVDNPQECIKCGYDFNAEPDIIKRYFSETPTVDQTELQSKHDFKFAGDGGTLFGIFILNVFLILVTLGIYYFWGKVKIRKYLYNKTAFEGDRFAYHGTGVELMIGWIFAAITLGIIVGIDLAADLFRMGPAMEVIANLILYGGLLIFIPIASVLSQRYRLSRTSWRGIRFSFRGRVKEFMKIYIAGLILTILTLGIYYPYFITNVRRYQANHSYFGNTYFDFDGEGREMIGQFVGAVIVTILTLGIYWFWFEAWKHRYFWAHTYFDKARFQSEVTGGSLFSLKIVNLLLLIFTLGLAWPWVSVRTNRYVLSRLTLVGELDLDSIEQDAREVSATGEEMADILDIDVMGMNLGV